MCTHLAISAHQQMAPFWLASLFLFNKANFELKKLEWPPKSNRNRRSNAALMECSFAHWSKRKSTWPQRLNRAVFKNESAHFTETTKNERLVCAQKT